MSYTEREKEFLQRVGSNMRRFRQEQRLSQEKLARKAEVGRSHLASIERGEKNVAALNLIRIAKALGVEIVVLLK